MQNLLQSDFYQSLSDTAKGSVQYFLKQINNGEFPTLVEKNGAFVFKTERGFAILTPDSAGNPNFALKESGKIPPTIRNKLYDLVSGNDTTVLSDPYDFVYTNKPKDEIKPDNFLKVNPTDTAIDFKVYNEKIQIIRIDKDSGDVDAIKSEDTVFGGKVSSGLEFKDISAHFDVVKFGIGKSHFDAELQYENGLPQLDIKGFTAEVAVGLGFGVKLTGKDNCIKMGLVQVGGSVRHHEESDLVFANDYQRKKFERSAIQNELSNPFSISGGDEMRAKLADLNKFLPPDYSELLERISVAIANTRANLQ